MEKIELKMSTALSLTLTLATVVVTGGGKVVYSEIIMQMGQTCQNNQNKAKCSWRLHSNPNRCIV